MNKTTKQLIILYLIIVILKVTLAYFILAPSAFSDYYSYVKVARNVLYHGAFTVHGDISTRPPLYSVALSPAYMFSNMEIVYFFMKVLNALMSSLIIFPAWLLSKEFFDKKNAMLLTALIAVLPAHFGFTFFLLTENLFYPLFLFSICFIYKSFIEKSIKWDVLSGVFIGLTYLTKINALILPFIIIPLFLFKLFKKEFFEVKKKLVMALFFFIVITPWLVRNSLIFGFGAKTFIGTYDASARATVSAAMTGQFVWTFLIMFALYLSYLMVATGFIFLPLNFVTFKIKDKKSLVFSIITITSMLSALLLSARHFSPSSVHYPTIIGSLSRIVGRYIEFVIPLVFINGAIGFRYAYTKRKVFFASFLASACLAIFASQLIFFPLFPVNDMSLSWLGVSKFVFDFLLYKINTFETIFSYKAAIFFFILLESIILVIVLFYQRKKLHFRQLLYILISFFLLINLLNFSIVYYDTTAYWYNGEQTQLGLWFNKYDPKVSTVLFDERDGCKISKTEQTCIYNPLSREGKVIGSATLIGFWMNDEIIVGQVNNLKDIDYVISRHELDLPMVKKTNNGIFLYKVK